MVTTRTVIAKGGKGAAASEGRQRDTLSPSASWVLSSEHQESLHSILVPGVWEF